jgi:hypothetical protein
MALREELENQRELLNGHFRRYKHLYPSIQSEDFGLLVRELLAPIVDGLPEEKQGAVVEPLYLLLLELLGKKLVGPAAVQPWVQRAWAELFPVAARHLTVDSGRRAVALSNAAYNLGIEADARPERWLTGMARLAAICEEGESWLACGLVQGWRHGLAWSREGALRQWERLPDALKGPVLEVEGVEVERLRRDLSDPWLRPGGERKARHLMRRRMGNFRGFGGNFLRPPVVEVVGGAFYVRAEGRCWRLDADYFGATLRPVAAPATGSEGLGPWKIHSTGKVEKDALSEVFLELREAASVAGNAHSLVVCTPRSHKLWVVAAVE